MRVKSSAMLVIQVTRIHLSTLLVSETWKRRAEVTATSFASCLCYCFLKWTASRRPTLSVPLAEVLMIERQKHDPHVLVTNSAEERDLMLMTVTECVAMKEVVLAVTRASLATMDYHG